jgi:DNA replication and repair protein RecF
MKFNKIALRDFRNIKEQRIVFREGLNILRGQNGQGKTNLIEAIYLLTHGRSFRTNEIHQLSNTKSINGFKIISEIEINKFKYNVDISVNNKEKDFFLNKKKVSTAKIKQSFLSLLFSPESLEIVKDSSQKRRELIDELCFSLFPEFAKVYSDYRKIMRQKNFLLKNMKELKSLSTSQEKLIETLSLQLFDIGSTLTLLRLEAIEEIEPILLQEFLNIMDNHYANISINYCVSRETFKRKTYEEIHNAMYKRWCELKSRELATGLCLVGPHKHDVQFNFNDQNARFYCSQGQQRAIVLAFKMAQTRLHFRAHKVYPILLLDDVLSELDREKQDRFINYLLSTKAQVILTTTDATKLSNLAKSAIFEVKEGLFIENQSLITGGLSV